MDVFALVADLQEAGRRARIVADADGSCKRSLPRCGRVTWLRSFPMAALAESTKSCHNG